MAFPRLFFIWLKRDPVMCLMHSFLKKWTSLCISELIMISEKSFCSLKPQYLGKYLAVFNRALEYLQLRNWCFACSHLFERSVAVHYDGIRYSISNVYVGAEEVSHQLRVLMDNITGSECELSLSVLEDQSSELIKSWNSSFALLEWNVWMAI